MSPMTGRIGPVAVYTSSFPGTEDPLSENGHWVDAGAWNTLAKNDGAYASGSSCARRLTDSVSADQYAEITYDQTPGDSAWIGVLTRIQGTANGSGYLAFAYFSSVYLYHVADDLAGTLTLTQLDEIGSAVGTAPRRLRLESEGATHRVSLNGALRLTVTDASYATGSPGIAAAVFPSPAVKIQTFEGGNLFGSPPVPVVPPEEWRGLVSVRRALVVEMTMAHTVTRSLQIARDRHYTLVR